ncbi:hypothetical protein H7J08_30415 [Mycobacterium frederiksbergense]|uniref:hypothetical protein n=1 Tax=Mycolicibacterium frederiksbergense TaxID=117567 RepID=UPI0021F37A67|nr:hypothetical protein [Mycolicibacterium frederiksbergense]MCV7048949.1 hypothetical protein [Mycolicibacterium frederiksbergense]
MTLVTACGQNQFNAGECVTIKDGITNDDLEEAECATSSAAEQLDGKGVYRVSQAVDYETGCPRSTDVTFDHEPHDAPYCLEVY